VRAPQCSAIRTFSVLLRTPVSLSYDAYQCQEAAQKETSRTNRQCKTGFALSLYYAHKCQLRFSTLPTDKCASKKQGFNNQYCLLRAASVCKIELPSRGNQFKVQKRIQIHKHHVKAVGIGSQLI
jgi:hypothetical protein